MSSYASWIRYHFSVTHLRGAVNSLTQLEEIEKEIRTKLDKRQEFDMHTHMSCASTGLILSAAFLEATINEVFVCCYENNGVGLDSAKPMWQGQLARKWENTNFTRGTSSLRKYQVALELANVEKFSEDLYPYREVKLVFDLRNALVHFKPASFPTSSLDEQSLPVHDFEPILTPYVGESPFRNLIPTIRSPGDEERTDISPYFPQGCLYSGAVRWAISSSLAFTEDFFTRLSLRWYYEFMKRNGELQKFLRVID